MGMGIEADVKMFEQEATDIVMRAEPVLSEQPRDKKGALNIAYNKVAHVTHIPTTVDPAARARAEAARAARERAQPFSTVLGDALRVAMVPLIAAIQIQRTWRGLLGRVAAMAQCRHVIVDFLERQADKNAVGYQARAQTNASPVARKRTSSNALMD